MRSSSSSVWRSIISFSNRSEQTKRGNKSLIVPLARRFWFSMGRFSLHPEKIPLWKAYRTFLTFRIRIINRKSHCEVTRQSPLQRSDCNSTFSVFWYHWYVSKLIRKFNFHETKVFYRLACTTSFSMSEKLSMKIRTAERKSRSQGREIDFPRHRPTLRARKMFLFSFRCLNLKFVGAGRISLEAAQQNKLEWFMRDLNWIQELKRERARLAK